MSGGVDRRVVRFGPYEVSLHTGELRKHGLKVRLQDLPFRILALLLEHPGEMVTREELREKLWSADTFVEFEHSVNTAISRLRTALGDSAEMPRYIETLPRRGYRFIGTVKVVEESVPAEQLDASPEVAARTRRLVPWGVAALTVGLAVACLAWWYTRPAAPAKPTAATQASIAVLPLENFTGDPSQEYFVDGMTDAVITDLAQIRALRVISRTSVMRYKNQTKPLPEIARELRVDHIVEGSVLRSGDRVRITVQLVEAGSDSHMWAQNYERDMGDVLALQSEVAQAIAGQIRVQLTPRDQAQFANRRRVNPKAYEAVLKGRHHTLKWTVDEIEKGREYFQQAISEDPTFAPAYVGLADTYVARSFYSGARPSEVMPKAEPALMKALELDSDLVQAHRLLGLYRGMYEHNWGQAELEFHKALELAPGDAWNHYSYAAHHLALRGRLDEALEEIQRARDLAPLSVNINSWFGRIYMYRREYGLAVEQFRQTLELDPNFGDALFGLAIVYGPPGKYEEALAGDPWYPRLAWVRALEGKTAEAREALNKLREISSQGYIQRFNFAYPYAALGEKDEALAWLEKSYQEHELHVTRVKVDPRYDPLREDPRFAALLKKLNLED
ncbi:MAG: tetratricopeptide repeat protein [bacterium]|nr:tetratricopeptide repeat protein [bacterium]